MVLPTVVHWMDWRRWDWRTKTSLAKDWSFRHRHTVSRRTPLWFGGIGMLVAAMVSVVALKPVAARLFEPRMLASTGVAGLFGLLSIGVYAGAIIQGTAIVARFAS